MKFIALALLAVVSAEADPPAAKAVGVACDKGGTDFCGPTDSMCCGTATGGVLLDGSDAKTTKVAPNIVICNKTPTAEDYTGQIYSDGTNMIKATYVASGFTCMAGAQALIASAAAVVTLASMI